MFEQTILKLLEEKKLYYKDLLSLVKENILDIDTAEDILNQYTKELINV